MRKFYIKLYVKISSVNIQYLVIRNNNNISVIFMPWIIRHYVLFIIALVKYTIIAVYWSRIKCVLWEKSTSILKESGLNVEKLPPGDNCLNTTFRRRYGLLWLLGRSRLLSRDISLPQKFLRKSLADIKKWIYIFFSI